jgi:thioredoxin reductase
MESEKVSILIIGSGPAGYTAPIYAKSQHETIIISRNSTRRTINYYY